MTDKFLIGHAQNDELGTGVTVILAKDGAVGGVSVRGSAPGTRETDLLKNGNTVEKINAVVLTGGSAFGLDSCSGVVQYLKEISSGYGVGKNKVPIVCGAVLYDLDYKMFGYPDKEMGYLAAKNAKENNLQIGSVGAGAGATVGKLAGFKCADKGGLGFYSMRVGHATITAIVAVNAVGDIYNERGEIIAGAKRNGRFVNLLNMLSEGLLSMGKENEGKNTTIGCVLTDAKLTKVEANKLAELAHDGYAQAIRPVHTELDGDTVFVMASGEKKVSFLQLSALVPECMKRAIVSIFFK